MKSFFKKLAFVMALAMVVSLAAPAAQPALAATEFTYAEQETGLKVTVLNMNVGDSVDLKFNGVSDYKNYKLTWESENEEVATVDNHGVITAVGAGTTTVELQVADSEYVSKKVVVNVGLSNWNRVLMGTSADELLDGEMYDLKRGVEYDLNFYGVPDWSTKRYECAWTVSEGAALTVDKYGVVSLTEDAQDEAGYLTLTIVDKLTNAVLSHSVFFCVEYEAPTTEFEAEQTSDTVAKLTFDNTEITKEELEKNLEFYYYVGKNKISYPIQVSKVEDGVATLTGYSTFIDGWTYGFTYGESNDEFTATIGAVHSIECKPDFTKVYAERETNLPVKLYNAQGVDITTTALNDRPGASLLFTLVEESQNGEFWISDSINGKIYFNAEGKTATVKVEYITGEFDQTTYEPIPGPTTVIPLTSRKAPAYGIDISKGITATIGNATPDWDHATTTIALGDDKTNGVKDNATLVVKVKDIDDATQESHNCTTGTFSFESTNPSVLYVTENGKLMTNRAGDVNVLVKFKSHTAGPEVQPSVIGVVTVKVAPRRVAASFTLDKYADTVSTVGGFNQTTFKVTVVDGLDDGFDSVPVITCNNADKLPTGAASAPAISAPVHTDKGEYTFTITGDENNLPTNATGYTYNFTVKVGENHTRTFSVTIKKPITDNGNTLYSGYKVEFSGANDLKTTDGLAKNAFIDFFYLSNGVKSGVIENLQAKKSAVTDMIAGNYYYAVTKNGENVTVNASGSSLTLGLTTLDANDHNAVVKGNAAGTYTVVLYKAVGSTIGASASAVTSVASATLNVNDTQDTMSYGGKLSNKFSNSADLTGLVKNCFKFHLGGTTFDGANDADYTNKVAFMTVDANTVANGEIVYINSVTFYVKAGSNATIKYTVQVGETVEIAQ